MAEPDHSAALLVDLRTLLNNPGLTFAEAPGRLTGGYDTTVYAFRLNLPDGPFGERLVARIFRGDEGNRALREAAIHDAVAAQGYPAPTTLHVAPGGGAVGRPYFIMRRAPGRTLLAAGPFGIPARLAAAHAALHALNTAAIRESLRNAGQPGALDGAESWFDKADTATRQPGMGPLRPAFDWLVANRPRAAQETLCHLDFHPLNILVHNGEVSGVIDWGNAALADPAADVAVTRVISIDAPLKVPRLLGPLFQAVRRWLAWRYTRAYERILPLEKSALRYYEAMRCFQAMSHLSQRRLADLAGRPGNAAGYGWSDPATIRRVTNRFRRIAGVRLEPVPEAGP